MINGIDYNKRSKLYLFLMFLIGGVFGFINNETFLIGTLIGSGLGIMLVAVALGYILHSLIGNVKTTRVDDLDERILDGDIKSEELKVFEEKAINHFQPFKYGLYISLTLVLVSGYRELSRYFF